MDPTLKSHFLTLYCMVLADGVVDVSELQMLYEIGIKDYGLKSDEIFEAVRDVGTSFFVPDSLEGKIKVLHDMAKIAWADGEIDSSERELIKKYALHYGFQPENVEAIADFMLDSVHEGLNTEQITQKILN